MREIKSGENKKEGVEGRVCDNSFLLGCRSNKVSLGGGAIVS